MRVFWGILALASFAVLTACGVPTQPGNTPPLSTKEAQADGFAVDPDVAELTFLGAFESLFPSRNTLDAVTMAEALCGSLDEGNSPAVVYGVIRDGGIDKPGNADLIYETAVSWKCPEYLTGPPPAMGNTGQREEPLSPRERWEKALKDTVGAAIYVDRTAKLICKDYLVYPTRETASAIATAFDITNREARMLIRRAVAWKCPWYG